MRRLSQFKYLPVVILAFCLAAGCGSEGGESTSGKSQLHVVVGVPPYAYLVEQLTGEHAVVQTLVRPGEDPHTFAPAPQEVSRMGKADVAVIAGLPFEERLIRKVSSGEGAPRPVRLAQSEPAHDHEHQQDHHHGHHHGHHDEDLHAWLSPVKLREHVEVIADALVNADPENVDVYQQNAAALQKKLAQVHEDVKQQLAPHRGKAFFVFHPAFSHFAQAYGLEQQAVQENGRSPGPKHLRELVEKARAVGVKTLFVQPQFDRRSVQAIADAVGAEVQVLDPLEKEVIANIQHIADALTTAFEQQTPEKAETL